VFWTPFNQANKVHASLGRRREPGPFVFDVLAFELGSRLSAR